VAELTFLWHDYETFGLSPKRERPAQFAAIRTNAQLQEIGEPINWHCQLGPDYLPDPVSCLLTGITPQHCNAVGMPEHQFASRIEQELALPGTVGVGYNTIRFDDEFTRYLFWRNLIDPYGREWQNQCGRWDILDMVRTVYALRPDALQWPRKEDGSVSFKLEHLSSANGLLHEAAHDALSDVRATLALARLIRERQPRLFEFCLALRKKDRVLAEIKWPQHRPFLHVSGRFSAAQGCLGLMWPLSAHPTNRNELICWDLAHDPSVLQDLPADELKRRLFTTSSQLPQGQSRLPIKSIHINKSPVVISNLAVLPDDLAERWGLDKAKALALHVPAAMNLQWSQGYWEQVFEPYQEPGKGPVDVEEDLYGGFASSQDRRRLNQLRAQDPAIWGQRPQAFEDERLLELTFRYRARHYPASLSQEEGAEWQAFCQRRLEQPVPGARGWAEYRASMEGLIATCPKEKLKVLHDLQAYTPPLPLG
jgi:exodeoxyribonuclease-1